MLTNAFMDLLRQGMGDYSIAHTAWHLVIVASLIAVTGMFSIADTASGIYTAKKTGEKLRSHRLRKTIEKMAVYWFFQILVAIVGLVLSLMPWYNLPYLSMLLCVAICVVEGRSMCEHARRRKDHAVKIPEAVREIMDFLGGEANVREMLSGIVRKELERERQPVPDTDPEPDPVPQFDTVVNGEE